MSTQQVRKQTDTVYVVEIPTFDIDPALLVLPTQEYPVASVDLKDVGPRYTNAIEMNPVISHINLAEPAPAPCMPASALNFIYLKMLFYDRFGTERLEEKQKLSDLRKLRPIGKLIFDLRCLSLKKKKRDPAKINDPWKKVGANMSKSETTENIYMEWTPPTNETVGNGETLEEWFELPTKEKPKYSNPNTPNRNRIICFGCKQTCWKSDDVTKVPKNDKLNNTNLSYQCKCSHDNHCKAQGLPKQFTQLELNPSKKQHYPPFSVDPQEGFKTQHNNFNFLLKSKFQICLTHIIIVTPEMDRISECIVAMKDMPFNKDEIAKFDNLSKKTWKKWKSSTDAQLQHLFNNSAFLKVNRYSNFTEIELPKPLSGCTVLLKLLSSERGQLNFTRIYFAGFHSHHYPSPAQKIGSVIGHFEADGVLTKYNQDKPDFTKLRTIIPYRTDQILPRLCTHWNNKQSLSKEIEAMYLRLENKSKHTTPCKQESNQVQVNEIQGYYYDKLLPELQPKPFFFLNIREVAQCRLVCRSWNSIVYNSLPMSYIAMKMNLFLLYCNKFDEIINLVKQRFEFDTHLEDIRVELHIVNENNTVYKKGRVKYLDETITDLKSILTSQQFITFDGEPQFSIADKSAEHTMLTSFAGLTDVFQDLLFDAYKLFVEIFQQLHELSDNFDIVELTIRRYFVQMSKMFIEPAVNKSPQLIHAELIIEDTKSRALWVECFGENRYWVSYVKFEKLLIRKLLKNESDKSNVQLALEVLVHFPKNDCITTYAFHLLGCHWGPHDAIIHHIKQYALHKGFLGLMNLWCAEENIKKQNSEYGVYLIRLSRLSPEQLTISYGIKNGSVTHLRKPKTQSIKEYLSKHVHSYKPVDVSFHWQLAHENSQSVTIYATASGGYSVPLC